MWENEKIEGSQFLGSVWQPQRTIKLQPKEIEIYDNLINNALCMTSFRTMLKHSTFRDRIQMTADIFEPAMLCFIKEEVRESSPLHCTPSSLDEQLSLPVPAPKQGESQSRVTIHNQQLLSHCQKSDVTQNKWISEIRHLIQLPFSRILIWLLVLGCLKVLDDSQAPCNECQNNWVREPD